MKAATFDCKTPAAQINIMISESGATRLSATFMGRHDSTYSPMDDGVLLMRELPKLLAELRSQIQSLSGSAVTE